MIKSLAYVVKYDPNSVRLTASGDTPTQEQIEEVILKYSRVVNQRLPEAVVLQICQVDYKHFSKAPVLAFTAFIPKSASSHKKIEQVSADFAAFAAKDGTISFNPESLVY